MIILMRCIRSVQTFEGELAVGDVFAVGYKHERVKGKLVKTTKIPGFRPETRSIELRKLGIAVTSEETILETIPPVLPAYYNNPSQAVQALIDVAPEPAAMVEAREAAEAEDDEKAPKKRK